MRLASARRSSSKMASEGASGEAPGQSLGQSLSVGQSLSTAVLSSADTKCELNMDNLSKPELLTLLSVMEGELEARDLVIEALRAQRKEVFLQERYGHYSLRDPFLALQRDMQCSVSGDKESRVPGSSPMAVLQAVMAHCRKMQERMSAQLAAAETRHKRLEMEKLQLQSLEQEHRKLTAQLKDERDKNKHIVMMLVRECKQLATRVVEESQRFDELQTRYDEETRSSSRLQEELDAEKQKSQQMEAKMEKQLSELDTEQEQLRAKLTREETENQNLREQMETLRTGQGDGKEAKASENISETESSKVVKASVSVATDPVSSRTISCQTDSDAEAPKKGPLSIPVKPSPANYVGLSLPKSRTLSSENGSESAAHVGGVPSGVSPRVQAARYKFQEQDQNQNGSQSSPPARDLSPTNRETNFAAKQQARHTVTQVLSRFTSPPSSTPLRPGLPHSASESGPFPGRLSHPIGIKSPTVARIDRGNPPPIPPKKPGLSQTPAPSGKTGEGGRAGLKPVTPQLPPKPALDLVPALAASQTKMASAACAIPPPSPSVSLEATASGRCPPVALGAGGAGSGALDSDPLLLPAAAQEHATLMSMLLNRPRNQPELQELQLLDLPSPLDCDDARDLSSSNHCPPSDLSTNHVDDWDSIEELRISALFAAAQNGNTDDVKLLLSAVDVNVSDSEGFTPLHYAAAHGHSSCVTALLSSAARVDAVSLGGRSALFVASESGQTHCVKVLLDSGADRTISTSDGCSPLHAAVLSGNLELLRMLLYHANPPVAAVTLSLSSELLNQTNSDGWTAAHIAAAHGHKECLEELCSHHEQNLEIRDQWDRTIHDLATDDCKDLLENLDSYQVRVVVCCSAAPVGCAMVAAWTLDHLDLGSVEIDRSTSLSQLWSKVVQTFLDYTRSLCENPDSDQDQNQDQERPLGLGHSSIKSICVGDTEWSVGEEDSLSPWDLVRKPPTPNVRVQLRGLSELCLDEVAFFSLIHLSTLNNYVRLVEQYGNLMLHGVEGSLQEDLAAVVAHCIQRKQEAAGLRCDVVRIQVDPDLTRDQLLDALIQAGLLVPVGSEGKDHVVVTLEHLERASSLSALMGDLCHALDHRGPQHTLHTSAGPHWLLEGGYIITTLSKPRLQGSELRLQQHLRWISLRWDQEPQSGLLNRTLRARLQASGESRDSPVWRSALWVTRFWQRLNSCLCRLGTAEALIGPELFMCCPLSSSEDVVRFLSGLWNSVVVPRIEAAIVSRVSPRRSPLSPAPSGLPGHTAGQGTGNEAGRSAGQRALVKAALGIVLNRAVLQDCPLSRSEMERFLPEFSRGSLPPSALKPIRPDSGPGSGPGLNPGSKPGSVSPRIRRRRDHRLRRSNTTPRKRAVFGTGLGGVGGSFRDGSQSTSDVRFINGELHSGGGLSLFSDEETDLIRELQNMCSSRSEPDISKISQTKEVLSTERSSQQQPPATPVSPSVSRSRLPLRCTRANNPRPNTNSTSTTNTTSTTTTTTTTTTTPYSNAAPTCPDDNQHFVNNNHLHSEASRSSEDAVWILHENYITHSPPLLPR